MKQNFMNWIHNLSPSLFNTFKYDEIFVIDSSEESSFETDLNSNSTENNIDSNSSQRSVNSDESEHKVEKKNMSVQTGEGLVDNNVDYTCQVIDKKMVKEKLR